MSSWLPWDDDEVAKLKELVAMQERLSASEIASRLQVHFPLHTPRFTRNGVIGKISRIGLALGRAGIYASDKPRPRPKKPNAGIHLGVVGERPITKNASHHITNFGYVPMPKKPVAERTRAYVIEGRQLRKGTCVWLNDDNTVCGVESRGSYCEKHRKIVYQPREAKK